MIHKDARQVGAAAPLRVTLHIGATKTGSSALQRLMFLNRDALREAGVMYPGAGIASGAHHVLMGAIHPGAWNLHGDAYDIGREAYFARGMAEALAETRAAGCGHMVLSSEYLWGVFGPATHEPLREALKGCRLRIFACLRDPAHWAESTYLQALKAGEKRDFAEWLALSRRARVRGFDFPAVLESWAEGTGAASLCTVPYVFDDLTEFMGRTFAELTGVELSTMPQAQVEEVINPSPTREGMRRILELNRKGLPDGDRRAALGGIMHDHARPPNARELFFPESHVEKPPTAESLSPPLLCAPAPGGPEARLTALFGAGARIEPGTPGLGRGCLLLFAPGAGAETLGMALQATGAFTGFGDGLGPRQIQRHAEEAGIASLRDYLLWLDARKRAEAGVGKKAIWAVRATGEQALALHRLGALDGMFSRLDLIVIRRRDVFAQAAARHLQHVRGKGHAEDPDVDTLSRLVEAGAVETARIEQLVALRGGQAQLVLTEDLAERPDKTLRGIFRHLGIRFPGLAAPVPGLAQLAAPRIETLRARYLERLSARLAVAP